jgi:hypothetical protein
MSYPYYPTRKNESQHALEVSLDCCGSRFLTLRLSLPAQRSARLSGGRSSYFQQATRCSSTWKKGGSCYSQIIPTFSEQRGYLYNYRMATFEIFVKRNWAD